ncbi:MAG: ABC transporter permease [Candidatus Bathyarchaeia archaeon]
MTDDMVYTAFSGTVVSPGLEVAQITILSLSVSTTSIAIAGPVGILLGAAIGLREFQGKNTVVSTVNSLMGIPPVFVGLMLLLALSESGPLGFLKLLFTPSAMVLAQVVIALPIVTAITASVVGGLHRSIKDTATSLGATSTQLLVTVLREGKLGLFTAVIVAFGRVISEVGAIIIVGGDIRGFTRTLTTGIVGLTRIGEFEFAMVLGAVLVLMFFGVNMMLTHFQRRTMR